MNSTKSGNHVIHSIAGASNQPITGWYGHAWVESSVTLADVEELNRFLSDELKSNSSRPDGTLGVNVDDSFECSVLVCGVQFMNHNHF